MKKMAQQPVQGQTIGAALERAREAQPEWADFSVGRRCEFLRSLRHSIAESASDLVELFSPDLARTRVDSLTAEILPLAEACRYVEREAGRILRPRRLSNSGKPWLSRRVDIELRREPVGVVLIIGPANYPLLLPGVQALQALAAGNAVIWKPGRGGKAPADAFATLAHASRIPEGLLQVLDESPEAARDAIREGVDKVVLTGSLESGQAVLREAAEQITPAIVELSGNDCVIVHRSADLKRAARAIAFGLRLNGGATCIAPRRILVDAEVRDALIFSLQVEAGYDFGIPVLSFDTPDEAIAHANRGCLALGASIFADEAVARKIATRISAGAVVINDMIVPTADPRFPFGGRKASGFGTTRGEEGLLQMTVLKAIAVQGGRRLRHLEPLPENAEELFVGYVRAVHGRGFARRWRGWRQAAASVMAAGRKRKGKAGD
jgi:acyl-CoA reductase-like NAD-dependent aldehyde dehydrogenase